MSKHARRIQREANRTIFSALLKARRRFGGNREALIDADDRRLTYTEIVRAAFGLGSAIARRTRRGERVGIMMPTGVAGVIAFFAVLAYGRVPAMLNFTAGPRNLNGACKAAQVTKIITAHRFIEVGALGKLEAELAEKFELLYLEDIREGLTLTDKIAAVIGPYVNWIQRLGTNPDAPGVILFTSGTEGDPKGVVLSHRAILSNVTQIDIHIELEKEDIAFNPLPIFHCYGLTAGTLLPMFIGRKAVLHPSPLQVKIIPQRVRETQATILFATDTFLQQYARAAGDADLQSLRFSVCGAERVRDETRAMVKRRFNLDVLEGYGVTEAAPVIAANQPGNIRSGTVGKMLPCIEARLEPVEGLPDAGRLFVRGPNIMTGYISADNPGEIQPPEDGWHDTGDVVAINPDGYVSIRDRLKRFAKIGGEMVSLSIVENCAQATWPDYMHAAVAVPDARRGEQIILVTECPDANHEDLRVWSQHHGVSPLALPKRLFIVESVPVLGTGKINHVAVSQYVKSLIAKEAEESAVKKTGEEVPDDGVPKTDTE